MTPTPGMMPTAPPTEGGQEVDETTRTGPQSPEQESFDMFVSQAMTMVAAPENKGVRNSVLQLLGTGDPSDALARATVYIVDAVEKSGTQAGHQFSNDTLIQAGGEIMSGLVELAEAKKVREFTEDDMNAAMMKAMDLYREQNPGRMDQQAAQSSLQQLAEADRQGRIEEVAPGMTEAAEMMKQLMGRMQNKPGPQVPQRQPAGPPPGAMPGMGGGL